MIVKIVKARTAGSGRGLATYVLALRHERLGERLGSYVPDERHPEKVEWARVSNIAAPTPADAISAIERYNAQNLRKHRISRWEHIIVSFQEGERPDRRQMEIIEDRLMEQIGFGDHPRISAVHSNGRNSDTGGYRHLHIAVTRIDPTTLKAEHPRQNYYRLQHEAARLEIELGLGQEYKTLLRVESREIEELRLQALQRASWADKVPSGCRELTVQDVALYGNATYAALVKKAADLRDDLRRIDYGLAQRKAYVAAAQARAKNRLAEMSLARKLLHKTGVYRDIDLDNYESWERRSQNTRTTYKPLGGKRVTDWGGSIRRQDILDKIKATERQAAKLFELIRPAAEVELKRARQIAQAARTALGISPVPTPRYSQTQRRRQTI